MADETIELPQFSVTRSPLGLVELRCNGVLVGTSQDALSDEEFPRLKLTVQWAPAMTIATVHNGRNVEIAVQVRP